VLAVVEDRGGEGSVSTAHEDALGEVVEGADAAGGDHGNRDRIGDGAGEGEVVALRGAVAVHAREQDLAGAALGGLGGPTDGVAPLDPAPAAGDVDVPGRGRIDGGCDGAGVDRHDDALGSEDLGELVDQLRAGERGGVDADLVGAGIEDRLSIGDRADPAADRERDEDFVGGAAGKVDNRLPALMRCGDVQEDELVGALGVVARRELDRVAGIADVDEVGSLDDPPIGDVEAGDQALQRHPRSVRARRPGIRSAS
jgi:hypothetical protein